METMQPEPVADGHEPMTSADVVPTVLCLSHGQVHSQVSGNTLFFGECWYPDKLRQNKDIGEENALRPACC
jgi:hypothetical protein